MPKHIDFISTYVQYADVIEAPPEAHEAVATALLASVLNEKVSIEHGPITVPLDTWTLLLSPSGFGRNTLVELARPVLAESGLDKIVRNTTWGSRQAFYQNSAEHPTGLCVWPELSAVLKYLGDRSFAGVKEWLTDRYDSPHIPDEITYRNTGKRSDTPPIVFKCSPRLNILATSSLDWFTTNSVTEDATGGFIPRWMIFRLNGTSRLVPKPQKPDATLVGPLRSGCG